MQNRGVVRTPAKICHLRQKICRQIHEIKQKRFFCEMFPSWYFAIFYRKTSKFELWGCWLGTWPHIQAFQDFSWNFLISWDPKSEVVVHPLSHDNNLVPFHLWLRAHSLVVSDLRLEIKGSPFESGCYLCAEVSFQQ